LCCAYAPSGAYICTGCLDGCVDVWDAVVGSLLFTFEGHLGPVYAIVVSLDEYTVTSGGADATIRVWDLGGLLRDDPNMPSQDRPELTSKLMGVDLLGPKSSGGPDESFRGRPPTRPRQRRLSLAEVSLK